MHTFKDANDKEWSVTLDVSITKQVRNEFGVDLHKLDKDSLSNLTSNDETLVDVLSVVCQEQIVKEGLDAAGFARCLIGGALDDACNALMEELVFISRRCQSQVVAEAWRKTKEAETLLTKKALQTLEMIDMEKIGDEAMAEAVAMLGGTS